MPGDVVNILPQPGLPELNFADPTTLPAVVPLVADALDVLAALGTAPFGIYSGGAPVVIADTVVDLEYSKTYQISDFPVEDGAFASFDKVEQPFESRVRFASGGSGAARQALVSSVETVLGDLNTYDVVTPDSIYINANLTREDYRRTQSEGGASLLSIEVGVQEVRILAGSTSGQNTADPASASQINGGTVSPLGQGGIGSDSVASAQAALAQNPITTLPPTLGGGVGGIPVANPVATGGIGAA